MSQLPRTTVGAITLALTAATAASAIAVPRQPARHAADQSSAQKTGCSWLARSDDDTVNAAYPDTSATYWISSFRLTSGETLRIHGTYPAARYFSFHTYTNSGLTEDSQYDAEIHPRKGSLNPFRHNAAVGTQRRYVVTVRAGAVPKHRAPNTVYTGATPETDQPNLSGILIYRIYTPTDPASLEGSVPLPAITMRAAGTTVAREGGCETNQPTTGGAIDRVYNSLGYPSSGPPIPIPNATKHPTWNRASSNLQVAGLFGNQQNAYLTSRTSQQYGDVLVIHAKAPSFPDTAKGQPAYTHTQVRYWSICQNSETTRVVACVPDSKAPQRHGRYTIVISTAANRPQTATRSNGVAWIPWGPQPDGVLIYRNMVATPGFSHATQEVPAPGDAKNIMGAYYPHSHYCSTLSYDAKGPRHCTST